jgi:hypothetical protein
MGRICVEGILERVCELHQRVRTEIQAERHRDTRMWNEIQGRNENNKHAYLPTICEMLALELLKKQKTKESAGARVRPQNQ